VVVQRSRVDGWCAVVSAGCFGLVAACILVPAPGRMVRHWSSATIYPWWSLVLAVVCMVVALAAPVLRRRGALVAVTAATTGVFAAELAGIGLVARKHWHPAFGYGGGYSGGLGRLQWLALLVFAAGAVAAVASLVRLWVAGDLPRPAARPTRRTAVAVGAALLVLLPPAIGMGDSDGLDLTSLAAFALIYSLPWGLSIALTGWLGPVAARAVLTACTVCALIALVGPQMDALVSQPYPAFALASLAVLVTLLHRMRSTSDHRALTR
jgi:hypothetical protein